MSSLTRVMPTPGILHQAKVELSIFAGHAGESPGPSLLDSGPGRSSRRLWAPTAAPVPGRIGRPEELGFASMARQEAVTTGPEERLQRAARLLAIGAIRAARQKHASRRGKDAPGDAGMASRTPVAQPSRHEGEVQEQPAACTS
jgi:hypothetical protein